MTRRSWAVAALTGALVSLAAPAVAQDRTVADPAGDATGTGLDFTSVKVVNADERIVVVARFVEARRGDLVVSIDPRGQRGVRLVSEHRPRGTTRNVILPGAFSDRGSDRGALEEVPCDGFRVRWNTEKELARMTMPSSCLNGGDYGAVRFAFLSEAAGAGDTDYGPERDNGGIAASAFIPRG